MFLPCLNKVYDDDDDDDDEIHTHPIPPPPPPHPLLKVFLQGDYPHKVTLFSISEKLLPPFLKMYTTSDNNH